MLKSELRQQIRYTKRLFTQQQLSEWSLPIVMRLKERLRDARVVMAYYSLPDEVCTHQLIDDLVAEGKTVLLPKVLDDERMELHRYTGPQDLREGAFHIMEPVGAPFTEFLQIDVALIPGMAFDAQGRRLGRGKGYYDRLLTSVDCKTLGVCFDFQKVEEVPVGEHDMPVDEVI